MDVSDENTRDERENLGPMETYGDIDETFAMLHDMSNTRASDKMNEFKRLGGPRTSELP